MAKIENLTKIAKDLNVKPKDLFIDEERGEITYKHIKLFDMLSESLKLKKGDKA